MSTRFNSMPDCIGKQGAATGARRTFGAHVLLALAVCAAPSVVTISNAADRAHGVVSNSPSAVTDQGRRLRVGPREQFVSIAAAASNARYGDIIEIAGGDYFGDVAVWPKAALTIRGVNGVVRIHAAGRAAEDKAIWVFRGGDVVVENIEFSGARVGDRNGAGIRHEDGRLTVRRCTFTDNENGILVGNRNDAELVIENSRFTDNGAGDGRSHNLYVGTIAKLTVRGSYFARARTGHLIKSRARESYLYYNRFTDEPGGRASYEMEFPSGGYVITVGNLIAQGVDTENSVIVSYGAEGYSWPKNEFYFAHNTVVNEAGRPVPFIQMRKGVTKALVVNNVFVGEGQTDWPGPAEQRGNVRLSRSSFLNPQTYDFRLKAGESSVLAADPGDADGHALRPTAEYAHPARTIAVPKGTPLRPGAFQTLP